MTLPEFIAEQFIARNLKNIFIQLVNLNNQSISDQIQFTVTDDGQVSFCLESAQDAEGFRVLMFSAKNDAFWSYEKERAFIAKGDTVSASFRLAF